MPRLLLLAVAAVVLSAPSASAQTTLTPGDIVVVGFTSDNDDAFALLFMTRVDQNTVFSVTENGVLSDRTTFRSSVEGTITFTTTRAIPAGTVLPFEIGTTPNPVNVTVTTSGSFQLAAGGDQLIVYQGDASSPSFVYAFSSTPFLTTEAVDSNTTYLPQDLANGTTAIDFTGSPDNAAYDDDANGSEGTRAALLSLIADDQNYTTSSTRFVRTFPTFTVTDEELTLTLTDRGGTSAGHDWRHVAVATVGGSYDDILKDLWTQGFPGSDAPGASIEFCNAFTYSPTYATLGTPDTNGDGTANAPDGYECLSSQTASAPQGTAVLVFGYSDQDGEGPEDLPFTFGTPSPGLGTSSSFDYSGVLEYADNAAIAASEEGFNDLGNVFAGDIDWEAAYQDATTRANIDPTMYLYDPAISDFHTFTSDGSGGTSSDPTRFDGRIPRGQGFFVKASGASPQLEVPASAVLPPDTPLFGKRADPAFRVLARVNGEAYGSDAFLWFHDDAETSYDAYDAVRLFPFGWPYIATYTLAESTDGAAALLGYALPEASLHEGPLTIPFAVEPGGFGGVVTMDLEFVGVDALPEGVSATLVDRTLGTETPIVDGTVYSYNATSSAPARDPNSAPATAFTAKAGDAPRFEIVLSPITVGTDRQPEPADALSIGPNPAASVSRVRYALAVPGDVRLSVLDALGREVAVLRDAPATSGSHRADLDVSALPAGVYLVRLATASGVSTRSLVVAR